MKPWYKSKTIQSAALKFVSGAVLCIVGHDWIGLIALAWGIVDAWIRYKTTGPITFKKENDAIKSGRT